MTRLGKMAGVALLALAALAYPAKAQTTALEFNGSGGGTSVTPPTQGPVTFSFRNNTNNPTGNSFSTVAAPAPTATVRIISQEYANGSNFSDNGLMIGGTYAGDPHLVPMTFLGGGTSSDYTSIPSVTPGSGISTSANYAILMEARTAGLRAAGVAPSGRYKLATVEVLFNNPMSSLTMHLQGLGGIATKTFTAEIDIVPGQSVFATGSPTVRRLSSNGSLNTAGPYQIVHTGTGTFGAACNTSPRAGCGSFEIEAGGVSRLVFDVYLRSNDTIPWPSTGADGILLGFSGEISDMTSSFSGIPSVVLPGQIYTGLSATCQNAGPNRSRGGFCDIVASSGTISNLSCSAPADSVAPGTSTTCSFSYEPPLVGSGVTTVTFNSNTGAPNDRNGGNNGAAGNNPGAATTVVFDGSTTALSTPLDICQPVADRASFRFTATGGNEASYTLTSNSPFFYDINQKPVTNVAFSSQTLSTSPGVTFKPTELENSNLNSGRGEIVIISALVEGRPGAVMSVEFSDAGDADHDVFTIEDFNGNMLARFPVAGSDNTNNPLVPLTFTMPANGQVYARYYIADYASSYGARLDGGCLLSNLITVKTLTSGDPSPVEGFDVSYRIEVNNAGPSNATNISLTDLLPTGLTLTSANSSLGSYDPATGIWALGALAAGQGAALDLAANVNIGQGGNIIVNTTTAAAGDQRDPTTAGDLLQAGITVRTRANIVANKTVHVHSRNAMDCEIIPGTGDALPPAAIPGSCVEYTITLHNTGQENARGLSVTDVLSDRLIFVAATYQDITPDGPGFAFITPAINEDCGITPCVIGFDEGSIASGATGTIKVRAILQ